MQVLFRVGERGKVSYQKAASTSGSTKGWFLPKMPQLVAWTTVLRHHSMSLTSLFSSSSATSTKDRSPMRRFWISRPGPGARASLIPTPKWSSKSPPRSSNVLSLPSAITLAAFCRKGLNDKVLARCISGVRRDEFDT